MRIKEIHVKNFRSIMDASLPCDNLTALVGRNGAGKSSFLHALEKFYDPQARVETEDFHFEDVTQDMEITVVFAELSQGAVAAFSGYIHDDTLTITRIFTDPKQGRSGNYYGMRLQNPDFTTIRERPNATDLRAEYNEIRTQSEYSALPSVTSADAARSALTQWEEANLEKCTLLRDEGRFFKFSEGNEGDLTPYTN